VIAEPFAVIAGDDHDGAIQQLARAERVEQPRELRIGVGDLAVVRRAAWRQEILRRSVRSVGIVEMDPHKKC